MSKSEPNPRRIREALIEIVQNSKMSTSKHRLRYHTSASVDCERNRNAHRLIKMVCELESDDTIRWWSTQHRHGELLAKLLI